MRKILTTKQIAVRLQVTKATVWRLCRNGTLPAAKIGKFYRMYDDDLEQFIKSRIKKQAEEPEISDYSSYAGTQLPLADVTDEEMRVALLHLNDPNILEASPLTRFTPVASSGATKGLLLQRLLKEALNRLTSNVSNDPREALLISYLDMRYRERRLVSEIALKLGYSREHLARKYHKLAIQIFKRAFLDIVL